MNDNIQSQIETAERLALIEHRLDVLEDVKKEHEGDIESLMTESAVEKQLEERGDGKAFLSLGLEIAICLLVFVETAATLYMVMHDKHP